MAKKTVKKVSKFSPAANAPAASVNYRYEVIENVAASDVARVVEKGRQNPDYVTHNIEAEADGEFTVFFVFRK